MKRLFMLLFVSGLSLVLFTSFGCQSQHEPAPSNENASNSDETQKGTGDSTDDTTGDASADESGDRTEDGSKTGNDRTKSTVNSERIRRHWQNQKRSDSVRKGLSFLAGVQGPDGGWGQDGGQSGDARNPNKLESQGNDVANTSIAGLALLRNRLTPRRGQYKSEIKKAVRFVLDEVEAAPEQGLTVTDRNGTQLQRKLGRYVDTFLAGKFLSTVSPILEQGSLKSRVERAVRKIVGKIERNQKADGTWNSGRGWASAISTSFADQSLAAAEESGYQVQEETKQKLKQWAKKKYDASAGSFKADEAANVELYQGGASAQALSRTEADRAGNRKLLESVEQKVDNEQFINGFGSGGGEEFISYFSLSQTLKRTGSKKFGTWTDKITTYLEKTQNNDGSWAGRHCITGRVACTAAAILTMTEKRTASPELVSAK